MTFLHEYCSNGILDQSFMNRVRVKFLETKKFTLQQCVKQFPRVTNHAFTSAVELCST